MLVCTTEHECRHAGHDLLEVLLLTGSHLVLDGEVDEVGIYQHLVGRAKLAIVLEEQSSGSFFSARQHQLFQLMVQHVLLMLTKHLLTCAVHRLLLCFCLLASS